MSYWHEQNKRSSDGAEAKLQIKESLIKQTDNQYRNRWRPNKEHFQLLPAPPWGNRPEPSIPQPVAKVVAGHGQHDGTGTVLHSGKDHAHPAQLAILWSSGQTAKKSG